MRLEQIAAQLYTVRQYTQTARELAETLRKIRAIGYSAVQISGVGSIPESEILAMLEGEGLTCCATHEPGEKILKEPERVAERLRRLKCSFTAFPIPAGVKQPTPYPSEGSLNTVEDVKSLAAALDRAGRVLREAGITLTYHNHAAEFRRYGGKTMLEILYSETDPRNLQAELDTYWVQAGGASPVEWCRRLKGRLPLIHLKDYGIGPDFKPAFMELGQGNLDLPAILSAAEEAGCLWYIVEQDICPGDPFESLRISYAYLRERIARAAALS